jgi:hypothetical protein
MQEAAKRRSHLHNVKSGGMYCQANVQDSHMPRFNN